LPCRIAVVSVLGLLALVLAIRTPVLTAVPAWSWLLLLAALLAPAVFVELPLCVGNRRVQVAELYEAALLVALSLRTVVWLRWSPQWSPSCGTATCIARTGARSPCSGPDLPACGAGAPWRVLLRSCSDVSRRSAAAVGAVHAPHAALTQE